MNIRMQDLQARVKAWHCHRFPDARSEHVCLKLCEEAGEVARAVNGDAGFNSATGGGDAPEEVADVFIASLVLLARWYPHVDIVELIERKVSMLETPGAHRASAR